MIEKKLDSIPVGIGGDLRRYLPAGEDSRVFRMEVRWPSLGIGPFFPIFVHPLSSIGSMDGTRDGERSHRSFRAEYIWFRPIRWDLRLSFPGEGVRGWGDKEIEKKKMEGCSLEPFRCSYTWYRTFR